MLGGIPEKNDVFNAFTVSHGNLVRGAPFICDDEDSAYIFAIDDDGNVRDFLKSKFVFKEVKGDENV